MRLSDEKDPAPAFHEVELGAVGDEQLPLRLIDVFGTILNSHKGNVIFQNGSSKGWDFQIISHTWSKGIRDLSEEIGKLVIHDRQDAPQRQQPTLSAAPGSSCPSSSHSSARDAYSIAFKDADLSEFSSYRELREFLQLLAGDGVKYVWFDALCIDQTNVEEKSREICNMGAYYHRSQGCYVLTHGVGEGYQLWGKQGPRGTELPRWFSRVWTLQEFLLPRRLSFFVENLDPRFLIFVNKLARARSKSGLCRCFCRLPQAEEYKLVKSICDGDDQVDLSWATALELRDESMKPTDSDDDDEDALESFTSEGLSKRSAKLLRQMWNSGSLSRQEFLQLYMQLLMQDREKLEAHMQAPSTSFRSPLLLPIQDANPNKEARVSPAAFTGQTNQNAEVGAFLSVNSVHCAECQSLPIIRRAKRFAEDAPSSISTTSESTNERTIYLVDREAYLGVMQCDSRMMEPPPPQNTKGVQDLRGLYARLLTSHPWTAWGVIVEVGRRNCTVEEDRVLGILGLLGKGGGELSQLRSGRGLQEQIRDLAKACSPEMFVELCGMDVRGCGTPGMSWAPDFHDPPCHDFWFSYVHRELRAGQNSLSVQVERERVTASGALKLRAKAVQAYVLAVAAMPAPLQNTPFIKSFLTHYTSSPCSHFIIIPPPCMLHPASCQPYMMLTSTATTLDSCGFIPMCCTADPATSTITFEFHYSVGNTHKGSMRLPIAIDGSAIMETSQNQHSVSNSFDVNDLSFHVEMVLLAGTDRTQCGDTLQLIMLCLQGSVGTAAAASKEASQESDQELHKIGMLSLITDPELEGAQAETKRLHFEKASMKVCTIGGFGADVSAHVHFTRKRTLHRPQFAQGRDFVAY